MKLIIREENYVKEYIFDIVGTACFGLKNYSKDKDFQIYVEQSGNTFTLLNYNDPLVAEYVFNLICEYINTDKILYLKTEEEYKAEIKEMQKIFKE